MTQDGSESGNSYRRRALLRTATIGAAMGALGAQTVSAEPLTEIGSSQFIQIGIKYDIIDGGGDKIIQVHHDVAPEYEINTKGNAINLTQFSTAETKEKFKKNGKVISHNHNGYITTGESDIIRTPTRIPVALSSDSRVTEYIPLQERRRSPQLSVEPQSEGVDLSIGGDQVTVSRGKRKHYTGNSERVVAKQFENSPGIRLTVLPKISVQDHGWVDVLE